MANCQLIGISFLILIVCNSICQSVEDVNEKNVREFKKPFRMAKINLVWEKAFLRDLSNGKLVRLFSELKVQDKQELTLKKHKAEGGDKEGKMEAQLRKSLKEIMDQFGLGGSVSEEDGAGDEARGSPQGGHNALFKDKKLSKLWAKAEQSGFTQEELKALQEEFQHHQDKIDQYYELLQTHTEQSALDNLLGESSSKFDELSDIEEDSNDILPLEPEAVNNIRKQHRSLKDGYHRLHKLSTTGANSKEFIEPKVAGLWRLAAQADFTQEELESLHTELKHYENRLLKVRHLMGEMLRLRKTGGGSDDHPDPDVLLEMKLSEATFSEGEKLLHNRVLKDRRTVDKLHDHLENKILQRHSEL